MPELDLSGIDFRAHTAGDGEEEQRPNSEPVDGAINLSGIVFRSKTEGDIED